MLPGQSAFVEHTRPMFVPPAHVLGIKKLVPMWHSASLAQSLPTLPVEQVGVPNAKLHVPGVRGTLFLLTALNAITLVRGPDLQPCVSSSHGSLIGQGFPECREQLPPLQVSRPLQKNPSSQRLELFACTQPLAGLHASCVQTLLSSQSRFVPLQEPLEQ